jgi:hypothetical protein
MALELEIFSVSSIILDGGERRLIRHCERSEAIQNPSSILDCFVAFGSSQ